MREQIKKKGKIKKKSHGITGNKPEPSLQQDDEQLISKNLIQIMKQIKRKEEKKGTKEENISPLQLRRNFRLRGMAKKVSSKGTQSINIEEETPIPSPDNVPFIHIPQNFSKLYF